MDKHKRFLKENHSRQFRMKSQKKKIINQQNRSGELARKKLANFRKSSKLSSKNRRQLNQPKRHFKLNLVVYHRSKKLMMSQRKNLHCQFLKLHLLSWSQPTRIIKRQTKKSKIKLSLRKTLSLLSHPALRLDTTLSWNQTKVVKVTWKLL